MQLLSLSLCLYVAGGSLRDGPSLTRVGGGNVMALAARPADCCRSCGYY